MKTILVLAVMFSTATVTATAYAGEVNPFDPTHACAGPVMSAQRALELLGSNFSVNLAASEKEQRLQGASRFRQIIHGVRGGWNDSLQGHYPISPFLVNKNGTIGLNVYFYQWTGARYVSHEMLCSYQDGSETFLCQNAFPESPSFGHTAFEAKLTDTCFSYVSRMETAAQEREWAFALHF